MGLNSDINEVILQIDMIINSKDGRWLNLSDYNLKSKDHKNMKSEYGLIHDILHHRNNGTRIIDRTHKGNLEYFYEKCVEHLKTSTPSIKSNSKKAS